MSCEWFLSSSSVVCLPSCFPPTFSVLCACRLRVEWWGGARGARIPLFKLQLSTEIQCGSSPSASFLDVIRFSLSAPQASWGGEASDSAHFPHLNPYCCSPSGFLDPLLTNVLDFFSHLRIWKWNSRSIASTDPFRSSIERIDEESCAKAEHSSAF